VSREGHQYNLSVYCFGFLEAFFLLTADAIRSGKHYQLSYINDENGNSRGVEDIMKASLLLY